MRARRILALLAVVLLATVVGTAQFKSQVQSESHVTDGLYNQSPSSFLFGWFDPSKFQMHHSISFSYQTFGGQGISLGTYTNSMMYQFADNLNARADISLSYSPYNTLPTLGGKRNDLSSIYLSRAEINYRPWENTMVQLQFRQLPYGYYYSPYSSFYNPFLREDGF